MSGAAPWRWAAAVLLLLCGLAPAPLAAQVMDDRLYTALLLDRFEIEPAEDARPLEYEAGAWMGGDYDRLWIRAEGEHEMEGGAGALELQALYGRVVAPFWELQGGVRVDARYGPDGGRARALAAVGLEGLAPYWFELAPFVFVSQAGDVSARLEASYELLFTQRLIAEPELRLDAALQEVREFGVGSGLNAVEVGIRVRYEIVRELAPYIGLAWTRRTGATAALARRAGEPVGGAAFVAGLRAWY